MEIELHMPLPQWYATRRRSQYVFLPRVSNATPLMPMRNRRTMLSLSEIRRAAWDKTGKYWDRMVGRAGFEPAKA